MPESFAQRIIAAHQAGVKEKQAEADREQAAEDRKHQQTLLKHQIDRLKIQDALEQRAAAAEQAKIMHGQPAPTKSVSFPAQGETSVGALPGMTQPAIPEHQAIAPTALPTVPFPEVPAIGGGPGLPGFDYQPPSQQDLAQQQYADELRKQTAAIEQLRQSEAIKLPGRIAPAAINAKAASERQQTTISQQDKTLTQQQNALTETTRHNKAMEKRPVGGLGTGAQPDDAKIIAQGIIEGKQPPTLTSLYRNAGPVRAELQRQGYDLATATRDWSAVQRHLSTLNGQQQERLRQAITFTTDSVPVIEDLFTQWEKTGLPGGFKSFNKLALVAASHAPGEAGAIASNLMAQINDLTSELGTVYKGGNSSTDESLRLAAANLDASWNDVTFKRALQQIKKNLQIRHNSIMTSQPVGVSPNSPYVPPQTPEQPAAPPTPKFDYVPGKGLVPKGPG